MNFTTTNTTNTKKTIVGSILIDRSGSMGSILPTLITSLHSFINETKETAEDAEECYFRISTFSTTRSVVYPVSPPYNSDFGDLNAVDTNKINFKTYGSTKLVDSAIEELNILSEKLDTLKDKDIMSWFVLLTDGEDNMSTFGHYDLKNKITKLKEKNVHCIFMGANIDAIKTGERFGFGMDQSIQVDMNVVTDETTAPIYQGFRSLSQNITDSLHGNNPDMSFSTMQRTTSAPSHFTTQNTLQIPPLLQIPRYNNNSILTPPAMTRQTAVRLDDNNSILTPPAITRQTAVRLDDNNNVQRTI